MAFRSDETLEFPFASTDRKVWYGIIECEEDVRIFTETSFTSSKSGKTNLINIVKQLINQERSFVLIGIWQGEWKTDIFVLEPTIAISMIRKVI